MNVFSLTSNHVLRHAALITHHHMTRVRFCSTLQHRFCGLPALRGRALDIKLATPICAATMHINISKVRNKSRQRDLGLAEDWVHVQTSSVLRICRTNSLLPPADLRLSGIMLIMQLVFLKPFLLWHLYSVTLYTGRRVAGWQRRTTNCCNC